ncbi:hypothetical protein BDY24DRAFT_389314 [Mrakia frigida]|uniref:uncharacterized protein n=1 Tax=Mrakia frigida TaxID=29902 RepID=UPI003FCC167E
MPTRRMLALVLLSSICTSLLLFTFVRPPPLPLPEFMSPNREWAEWGSDGQCLFLSPLAELSSAERAAAIASLPLFFHPSSPALHQNAGLLPITTHPIVSALPPSNPILSLIAQGEARWSALMSSQSRSLEEAVVEYRRRNHGREPPLGFDAWWQFAQTNKVMLPDEYDPIMEGLAPFFGMSSSEVTQRVSEAESVKETYTLIVKEGGKVVLQWNDDYSRDVWWSSRSRADAQINLMEPFLDKLGDMRITFSIHDSPSLFIPFARKQELLGLAEGKAHTTNTKEEDKPTADWAASCGPETAARKGEKGPGEKEKDTINFVSDHQAAMDPCNNPSLLKSHSHFLNPLNAESTPRPHTRLLPILSLSRTLVNADVPVAPVGIVSGGVTREDVGREPLAGWAGKSEKLYWRGVPNTHTKTPISPNVWANSHRTRFHTLATSNSSTRHAVMAPAGARDGSFEIGHWEEEELREIYLDGKLEGEWSCEKGDKECEKHRLLYSGKTKDLNERSNDYKYVLDLDGESWSKRFPKLMAASNLVIKAGVFPEWNMASLPGWFGYVPANIDYSDIFSIMAFFRGHPDNFKGSHDRVARRIASNGQCWVERTWRREDMQAYSFRLYLEYARAVHPERDTGVMDYKLGSRPSPMGSSPQKASGEKKKKIAGIGAIEPVKIVTPPKPAGGGGIVARRRTPTTFAPER